MNAMQYTTKKFLIESVALKVFVETLWMRDTCR
jgi:hypothetical protein